MRIVLWFEWTHQSSVYDQALCVGMIQHQAKISEFPENHRGVVDDASDFDSLLHCCRRTGILLASLDI
jgi:hypothetical protein